MASVFLLAASDRRDPRIRVRTVDGGSSRALPRLSGICDCLREAAPTGARIPLASLFGVDRRKTISRFYSRGLAPRAWLLRDSRSADGSASLALETMPPDVETSAACVLSGFRELARRRLSAPLTLAL